MHLTGHLRTLITITLLTLLVAPVWAQKKVRLKSADVAKSGRLPNGDRFERAIGDVVFTQNKTTIYCDSAHIFKKKNSLNAFGKIRITEGDSVTITGRRLEYDGNKRQAKLRGNVVFTKLGTATLYTDNLDFLRGSNIAYYFDGGKLVDSANVLTSRKGYYNLANNIASFKQNVKVVNPDHTMYADSLRYNSSTKIIHFVSRTTVVDKDSSTFVYESGVHHTTTKVSVFKEGTAETEEYVVTGDRYDVDAARNIAKVRGNVVMRHKREDLIIYGQASDYYKNIGVTKIYNNAYIAKVTDTDTLFIRADTLTSINNADSTQRRLLAFHNVRIFKSDLQGKADSLEYRWSDSTIYFYNQPVLWSAGNQLTADSIRMIVRNNTVSRIYMITNAFVVSMDTLGNFNQIRGRKMTADLRESKLSRVFVEGNGESLYYLLDDKTKLLMGVNKILCSSITIRFRQGRVHTLSFYVKPEGRFIPPHEIKKDELTLKGFSWKSGERPTRSQVVPSAADSGSH